jgi:preprotein translocase subunit YajC
MKKILRVLCLALAMSFACLSLTGCASTGEGTGGSAYSIIMLVVLVAVFYFFMIRPENKKKKKLEQMRNELSVGDKITTIGGLVGRIVDISGDLITFETGEDRVRIQVTKWAISTNSIQKSESAEK